MSGLARAFIAELDEEALDALAERLRPRLAVEQGDAGTDRWMSSRDAAEYLGLSRNALHKLTAARAIPFVQDVAGGKCWFLRSELNAWRRGEA